MSLKRDIAILLGVADDEEPQEVETKRYGYQPSPAPLASHWQIILAVAMILAAVAGFVWIACKISMI